MICVMVYFRTRLNGRGQNRTLLELSEAHSAHDFVIKSESHSQLPERTGMVCTRPGFYAFQGRKLKKDKAISNRKGVGGLSFRFPVRCEYDSDGHSPLCRSTSQTIHWTFLDPSRQPSRGGGKEFKHLGQSRTHPDAARLPPS